MIEVMASGQRWYALRTYDSAPFPYLSADFYRDAVASRVNRDFSTGETEKKIAVEEG